MAGMLAWTTSAQAELRPLWELGAGVGVTSIPAYRGARGEVNYILPLPYFVYRGRFLRSDRQGLRGVFYQGERVQINLSAYAGPPVQSGQIPARAGMPNLSPSFEIGPSLQYVLIESPDLELDLRLPVRAAFTLSFKPIGWISTPHLNLTLPDFRGSGWIVGASIGPNFADRRYHAYFYDVATAYARPGRPAYSATSGYSGSSVYLSASRRFGPYWVGAFLRYDNLAGASFVSSPLVETQQYLAAGMGVSWIFATSSRLVESEEP
ncbi:hypothetical protein Thpro_021736 [Acidihalobacter prosperus]|uniref:MipA/OmpV family protein n=2 Tax=Acidihalobacter prosperus TaxID=160660 RepID=A0A1A6C4B9_9GAMM|nr:hypothetical protein Thpro_021736 [Acidihalobacter prosperus]